LATNPKQYTVLIPTSPHLRKFLSVEYGNPVKLDNGSLLGVVIISLLSKGNFHVALKPNQKKKLVDSFTVSFSCIAPISLMKDYGHTITSDKIIQLNRFYEHLFYEKMFVFIQHRLNIGKRKLGVQDAIIEFCNYYDIELDREISYDALKKKEWRWRTKQKNIIRAFVPSNS